jgi:hypothetical protein
MKKIITEQELEMIFEYIREHPGCKAKQIKKRFGNNYFKSTYEAIFRKLRERELIYYYRGYKTLREQDKIYYYRGYKNGWFIKYSSPLNILISKQKTNLETKINNATETLDKLHSILYRKKIINGLKRIGLTFCITGLLILIITLIILVCCFQTVMIVK